MRLAKFVALAWLVAACGDITRGDDGGMPPDGDGGADPDAVPGIDGTRGQLDAGPGADKLDVLFVVDNSGSMFEEQAALATAFDSNFIANLRHDGNLPSLHIGVVSTDLGAGPFGIQGCTGSGDNGVLQNAPRGDCTPPADRYIIDLDDGDGTRTTNYTGTLAKTFSCIAKLGTNGCGFEQPLESMRRALDDNPSNAGFLRDDAALLVIIVSDEDDCSTEHTEMFDTSQTSPKSPLGPLSSFRCFEFGVECSPDVPRAPGMKFACGPREDSPYMFTVAEYIEFLDDLKGGKLVVAAIVGDRTPVIVNAEVGVGFELAPSCSVGGDGGRFAVPGVRFHSFLEGFPSRSIGPSICADMAASLQAITDLVNDRLL